MLNKTKIYAMLFVIGVCFAAYSNSDTLGGNANSGNRFIDRLELFPNIKVDQDVRMFAGHKDSVFRRIYFMAARTDIFARIISYDERLYFGINYTTEMGAGIQDRVMSFDPNATNYAIVPYLMIPINSIEYEIGLDHRCFHKIDRLKHNEGEPDWNYNGPYWNQVYVKVTSTHIADFPLRWQVGAGHFLRSFFGVDPLLISGEHSYDYVAAARLGYTFYTTGNIDFDARHDLVMLAQTSGDIFYAGKLGGDATFKMERYGFGLFFNYNYEFPKMLPFATKDRLFEFGMRFTIF